MKRDVPGNTSRPACVDIAHPAPGSRAEREAREMRAHANGEGFVTPGTLVPSQPISPRPSSRRGH